MYLTSSIPPPDAAQCPQTDDRCREIPHGTPDRLVSLSPPREIRWMVSHKKRTLTPVSQTPIREQATSLNHKWEVQMVYCLTSSFDASKPSICCRFFICSHICAIFNKSLYKMSIPCPHASVPCESTAGTHTRDKGRLNTLAQWDCGTSSQR